MGARSGKEYLEGLRDDREIWLEGERVVDVTTDPRLRGAATTLARIYDLHHAEPEVLLTEDHGSGELVPVSHVIPRSREDLERRRRALEAIALLTLGWLGRSPDYVNVTMAGFAGREDVWRRNGDADGAKRLVEFQREAMLADWCMTHAIVNPTIDKSQREVDAGDGAIALHKVGESADGLVVSGSRALATLAPFADEMVVYPGQPVPRDANRYALSFSIPMATPGLRFLCRESFAARPGTEADHPFSSRFDEQDAFVVFDEVIVPWERVFLDGDTDVYNRAMTTGWVANIMQQTTVRAHVKLRFAWELATRMAAAIGSDGPQVTEMLGELWTYAELTRSVIEAAHVGAHDWGNGVWFCDDRPFRAIRPTLPRWFPRAAEIITLLGAHSLLTTPSPAELAHPELRPLIDRYYQGANGMSAEERIAIFRTAWDFTGSALAGRGELYERFYLASSSRMFQVAQAGAARDSAFDLVGPVIAEQIGGQGSVRSS